MNQKTYESLRDEILTQLKTAHGQKPVNGIILCLHGAMVAQGYQDPEGDLIDRIRQLVGDDITIGISIDPHSHLTQKRVKGSNIIIAFKEFPHTDFSERGEELVRLTMEAVQGKIKPVLSIFDCKMIDIFPTSHPKMRAFVDKIQSMEADSHNPILSISLVHGFMAGDVPEMGTKLIVITDNHQEYGDQVARELGMEVFALRGVCAPKQDNEKVILQQALALSNTAQAPIVIADMWDNPGGGVAGDATVILKQALQMNLVQKHRKKIAFATIWDPVAVQLCRVAGIGAAIPLRFGGKSAPDCGEPIDATVVVNNVVQGAMQTFCESLVNIGDSALIEIEGIQVILNSVRAQVFERTVFTALGIDPLVQDILVVKSTNHFHNDFAKFAQEILYCDAGKPYPNKPAETPYQYAPKDIWPIIECPHSHFLGIKKTE